MSFKSIMRKNAEQVKKWPKWKRNIIISAEAASTGRFIKSDKPKITQRKKK